MHRKKPIGTSKEVEEPSGGGKTNFASNLPKSNVSNKKDAPPAGLPSIGQNSGIYLKDILQKITAYCQLNGLGDIVESLHSGAFDSLVLPIADETKLGAIADPHGFYRDHMKSEYKEAADFHKAYIRSKTRLLLTSIRK